MYIINAKSCAVKEKESMKLVRVFNTAAFLLIGTLLLAACALTAAPTATPDGSFAPTGEATFTAKPTGCVNGWRRGDAKAD